MASWAAAPELVQGLKLGSDLSRLPWTRPLCGDNLVPIFGGWINQRRSIRPADCYSVIKGKR